MKKNNKNIGDVRFANKVISIIKKGARTVWEAIRSCFGKGIWINTKGWINDDKWKNLN